MRDSKETLYALLQSIQAAVVVHGPGTEIIICNKAAQELLGLTEDQILGKKAIDPAWSFCNEDGSHMQLSDYPVNRVITSKKALKNFIVGINRPDKEYVTWVLVHAVPEFSSYGDIARVIVTFMNITQLRQVEAEHKEAEKKIQERSIALAKANMMLNEAQKIAKIGHWELELQSNTLSWSDEIYRIFGLTPQEFKASYEAFLDSIHPDDRDFVDKSYTASIKKKKPYDIEHRIVLKNGEIKWVREICTTEYDKENEPIRSIGTVHDITDKKIAAEQREQLIKELQCALCEIKTLRGIIPICSFCKKIRNDDGYWEQVDVYLHKHSEADISHGICQDCMRVHYPEEYEAIYSKKV
ncbi:MAG: PAS domain S-box protein [Candidatus Electrothrix sp. AUS4]|nr:PAS domain S-box protein [Candidatus Electrothrix sp. AUS4]